MSYSSDWEVKLVMASIALDMISTNPMAGHFEWNNQTNSLDFISSDPSADLKDKKRRGHDGTNSGPYLNLPKRKEGLTPNKSQHGYTTGVSIGLASNRGGGARTIGTLRASPKFGGSSRYNTNSNVTLKDIKGVAMDHLTGDIEMIHSEVSVSFRHLVEAAEFDDFLISLLHYFHCFFEQLEQELKPHKTSFLEPSKAELQALAETKKKLEVTKRRLGQSYCVLILGLGLEKHHHMGCGKKRVSSTHRDKKMFEDLYMFCTYVVWLTFRRKQFDHIKIEVGNMLRSKVFNPALQQKHFSAATSESEEHKPKKDSTKQSKEGKKKEGGQKPIAERVQDLLGAKLPIMERLTPAQHRQRTGKRPAIYSAIHQRSTALVALLPLPKEESEYLFFGNQKKEKPTNSQEKQSDRNVFNFNVHDAISQKIGIIGEPTENFNMDTLMPKSLENEEDMESTADGNMHGGDSPLNSDRGLNRQGDMISRATTAEEC